MPLLKKIKSESVLRRERLDLDQFQLVDVDIAARFVDPVFVGAVAGSVKEFIELVVIELSELDIELFFESFLELPPGPVVPGFVLSFEFHFAHQIIIGDGVVMEGAKELYNVVVQIFWHLFGIDDDGISTVSAGGIGPPLAVTVAELLRGDFPLQVRALLDEPDSWESRWLFED